MRLRTPLVPCTRSFVPVQRVVPSCGWCRSDPVFGDGRSRVIAAGEPLLDAARDSGEVRVDLSIEQVFDLAHANGSMRADSAFVAPILRAALDGLRPSR
jgi:hypothetical protein